MHLIWNQKQKPYTSLIFSYLPIAEQAGMYIARQLKSSDT
jgi:hypothetical protein